MNENKTPTIDVKEYKIGHIHKNYMSERVTLANKNYRNQ